MSVCVQAGGHVYDRQEGAPWLLATHASPAKGDPKASWHPRTRTRAPPRRHAGLCCLSVREWVWGDHCLCVVVAPLVWEWEALHRVVLLLLLLVHPPDKYARSFLGATEEAARARHLQKPHHPCPLPPSSTHKAHMPRCVCQRGGVREMLEASRMRDKKSYGKKKKERRSKHWLLSPASLQLPSSGSSSACPCLSPVLGLVHTTTQEGVHNKQGHNTARLVGSATCRSSV